MRVDDGESEVTGGASTGAGGGTLEGNVEKGVINLQQLFGVTNWNDFVNSTAAIGGSTQFQIPDVDWLIKHGWITNEEKDQGPFFVKEFVIIPFPELHSERQNGGITVWAEESWLNGQIYRIDHYHHKLPFGGKHDFVWQGAGYRGRPQHPYNPPNFPTILQGLHRKDIHRLDGKGMEAPTVFSPWHIKLDNRPTNLFLYQSSLL